MQKLRADEVWVDGMAQREYVIYCGSKYAKMYDDMIKEKVKTYKMSRYYRRKKPVAKQQTEEQIKAVFELYKPNKVQVVTMRRFGLNNWLSGNKKRVTQISNILGLSKEVVELLEAKYYLGYDSWTAR